MSSEDYSDVFYKGPAYALVIGISQYKFGREPSGELGPKEFTNLKVASQDAKDFAAFLRNYGFIDYNVTELLDEQATRPTIIEELDKLRRNCARSRTAVEPGDSSEEKPGPLIMVYFSGHGMPDPEGRHYLIPYDAERDRLRATALWNQDFSASLAEINTNRLVVFLDACHAGAIGMRGVKSGEGLQPYAPPALGMGKGRFLIASCGQRESSYEWKEGKNSIFTKCLLELLRCETDAIVKEEVDIFDLYPVLKNKVKEAADQQYGQTQEPCSEIQGATGIILAINKSVRQKRIEEQARAEKSVFVEAICDCIMKGSYGQKFLIRLRLLRYVDGERFGDYDELYQALEEAYANCPLHDLTGLEQYCEVLIEAHQRISRKEPESKLGRTPVPQQKVEARPEQAPQASERAQEKPRPRDDYNPEALKPAGQLLIGDKPALIQQASPTTTKPEPERQERPPTLKSQPEEQRRKLSQADRLEVSKNPTGAYFQVASALYDILGQPVTKGEFQLKVLASRKEDPSLNAWLDEVWPRFEECWERADVVEGPQGALVQTQTLGDLLIRKARDLPEPLPARTRQESQTSPAEQREAEGPPQSVAVKDDHRSASAERTGVFISYSHQDKKWLTRLETMLAPLVRNKIIDLWDDTKIEPGDLRKNEIQTALDSAKVAVLLVSANFLNSEFIAKNELPPLLQAAMGGGAVVFWIYISDCMYEVTEIAKFQAAHDISRPLDAMIESRQNSVLKEVCSKIKQQLESSTDE
jgi:hypothetical protein